MSEISMEIEKKTESLCEMCKILMDAMHEQLKHGIDNVNTDEAMKVVDMVKDLCEAEEKKLKAFYYQKIIEAMEDSEYGVDYDENGKKGYKGKYISPYTRPVYYTEPAHTNDTVRHSDQMRYSEPMRSAYDRAKKGYEESKNIHNGGSEMDKSARMQSLEQYMQTLGNDIADLINGMDSNEKAMLRNKLNNLMTKVQ